MTGDAKQIHADTLGRLAALLGPASVLTDPDEIDLHAWDALSQSRIHPLHPIVPVPPLCICTPASTAEVQAVVGVANEARVPLVPYGGGSGLMGAAVSLTPDIVVDLRKMNAVLEVDPGSFTARVQAGVVLEALESELQRSGLMLGHDPWTVPVATVGGPSPPTASAIAAESMAPWGVRCWDWRRCCPGDKCAAPAPLPRAPPEST